MSLIEADPDWLRLPEDVLLQALQRLPLPDLLRSSAVCPTWCSSTHELRRHPLHQAPWLMLTKEDVESCRFEAKFYSLTERRFYTFSLPYHPLLAWGIRKNLSPHYFPPFNRNVFHGSSHGWMIIADDRSDLYLFNPITGAQVRSLPPAATLDFIEANYDEQGELCHYYNHGSGLLQQDPQVLRRHCYRKIALSSSCPLDGEYTIMVVFNFDKLAFAKAGDKKWTTTTSDRHYNDIVFHNGDFYLLTRNRAIEVWDLSGNQKACILLSQQQQQQSQQLEIGYAESESLVPSPLGDLFLVKSVGIGCPCEEFLPKNNVQRRYPSFRKFEIHKIDLVTKEVSDKLENLGNHAFFFASNHSMCLSCTEFPELKPRCVYYSIGTFGAIGIYDIESGSSEYHELIDDADEEHSKWQPLTWIIPSLQ